MPFIVFRVDVDACSGNVGMAQVVAHSLQIHVVTLMGACCMPHPVRRGFLHMSRSRLVIGSEGAQARRGLAKHVLDEFVDGTTSRTPLDCQ